MSNIPYFDGHCDTISCCEKQGWSLRENNGHLDLLRLKAYSKAAQFFAMYHDMANAPADGLFAECKRQQAVFAREIEKNADLVEQCRTAEDVKRVNAAGKIAAILSCEGSELLNCDPDNLDWAREVGIKAINLTWNHANFIAGSHMSEAQRGLNDLGRAFVKKAQSYDILIDVSHCSDPAFWDLMEITEKPVIATHSNARAVCGHTRNLTDDMFKAIVRTGGVAGVNYWIKFVAPVDDPTMDDVIRHIDHFMELGGEKHIALGADLDGCAKLSGGMKGLQDMPMLWEALSKHGYSDALLEDIFYNNLLRVLA
ncbi:MAG: dipeptidase [Oscillospiraceae bacterium]|nr:dipeptidase [Oscillospiraceae bacterium]